MFAGEYKRTFLQKLLLLVSGVIIFFCFISIGTETSEELVDWESLSVYGDEKLENTRICAQMVNDERYLVLPSTISPSALNIRLEKAQSSIVTIKGSRDSIKLRRMKPLNLSELCGDCDIYEITIEVTDGIETSECQVKILSCANIDTMYLVSEEPVNKGRKWVEASSNKSNEATGSMIMQNANGTIIYNGSLTQIKGRGNSTWDCEKKSYQIKLDYEKDLLDTGKRVNYSKTWVLLANDLDPTMLRNTIALYLADTMGMEVNVESKYVDLYYDGEYRGVYLLSEKVEVESGRVDIDDMDDRNKVANPGIDLKLLSTERDITDNGATYVYCEEMESPENITGGYLLELDFTERAVEESCYFYTTRGNYVVVKSPEYASREEMDYIATLYQSYEDAVYNGGINPETGKAYTDYVDLESMVQYYLLNEFTKNRDGFASSAYLYKNKDEEILYMGPPWDYDLSLGIGSGELKETVEATGIYTARIRLGGALNKIESFRVSVKETYEEQFYPLIKERILGNAEVVEEEGYLSFFSYYGSLLEGSVKCNNAIWDKDVDWELEVEKVEDFCIQRLMYLKELYSKWSLEDYMPTVKYIDVMENDWYYEAVLEATKYGLMFGTGGDKFDPESYVQRAQAIQVIYRIEGEPITSFKSQFTDVCQAEWYSIPITWATENGLIMENPDEMFKPMDIISREDLIVFLYRYNGSPMVKHNSFSDFTDSDLISDYARDAVGWAVNNGLIHGDSYNNIRPKDWVTRAELAVILVEYYNMTNK